MSDRQEVSPGSTVLVEGDGEVVGRVNLVDLADGSAELGYRIT